MKRIDYKNMDGLGHIYLEDSYVLNILESKSELIFYLEVVLTPEHPQYTPPLKGEQHSYVRATLAFQNIKQLKWIKKQFNPVIGVNKEVDYGNINELYYQDGKYHVSGEWGILGLHSSNPKLTIKPALT